jgi:hypothetical protein
MSESNEAGFEAQDEVLQVMYWLRGEKLADSVSTSDLVRFVGATEPVLDAVLERLALLGFVRVVPSADVLRYTLTDDGAREGGRRFADEFADLTKPGHGECGDPECECRETGNIEDCRHAR